MRSRSSFPAPDPGQGCQHSHLLTSPLINIPHRLKLSLSATLPFLHHPILTQPLTQRHTHTTTAAPPRTESDETRSPRRSRRPANSPLHPLHRPRHGGAPWNVQTSKSAQQRFLTRGLQPLD
jgi:hypothetical protein